MRRKVGRFLAAVFVAAAVSGVMAQTVVPYPFQCYKKYLVDWCGEDYWRDCYMLLGCWWFGPPPDADLSMLPVEYFTAPRRVLVR